MNKEKNSFKDVALDFIKTLFISLIIVYILTRLIVRPISVNGNSMYPTLKDNDFGLATVFKTFINDVDRYDVVIIKLDSGEYIIKRVIIKIKLYTIFYKITFIIFTLNILI